MTARLYKMKQSFINSFLCKNLDSFMVADLDFKVGKHLCRAWSTCSQDVFTSWVR